MSALFEVSAASGAYTVKIEPGLFASTLADLARHRAAGASAIILADRFFEPALANSDVPVILLPAEETAKALDAIPDMIVKLRQAGANRKTRLFAIGGGIVQDIAAFIASIFMRGIPWTYLPTTFLGMTDSCIGGKSSINVGQYKNIVGTYAPPTEVLIDPNFTQTLSESQVAEGAIEAAKICYCRGPDTFAKYLTLAAASDRSTARLESIARASLTAKKWFIEIDEFDRKERLHLNFGHTFGHAVEGASQFAVTHGLAVGFGVLCAIEMAKRLGTVDDDNANVAGLRHHMLDLLASAPALGRTLAEVETADVLDRFKSDKKHGADTYSVILPHAGGGVELVRLQQDQRTSDLIIAALAQAKQEVAA